MRSMLRVPFLLALLLLLGGAAPRESARLAIIIGVNHPNEPGKAPLRYADDDAVRFFDLFRLLGARTHLLAQLDANTRRLHPQATLEVALPRLAELDRVVRAAAQQVAVGRARGVHTVLYVVYAGHGDVQRGQGYLSLGDARLTSKMLRDRVIRRVGASETHLIVDACHAYFIASPRGPGGRRRPLRGFIGSASSQGPSVGLLLATSAARQSHEWEGYQAGVFSHAVRSGLYGAADADGDGQVSYREIAAFVGRANASIPNERFRSRVYARPPRGVSTLVDLRRHRGRQLIIDRQHHGRYLLEDMRGIRLADFNSGPGQTVRLLRQGTGTLFLRRLSDEQEFPIPPSEAPVRLAALTPQPPRVTLRGAAHHAFSQMFALPFDRKAVAAYTWSAPPVVRGAPDDDAAPVQAAQRDAAPGRTPWRSVIGWSTLGLGAVALASGLALSLSAKDLHDSVKETDSQLVRIERNEAIDRRNTAAVALYAAAGASVLTGALLLLWPDGPTATAWVDPGGASLALGGRF